jgi:hypothetical protein
MICLQCRARLGSIDLADIAVVLKHFAGHIFYRVGDGWRGEKGRVRAGLNGIVSILLFGWPARKIRRQYSGSKQNHSLESMAYSTSHVRGASRVGDVLIA